MHYVDIGIPANNKGKHSIGVLFWLLARMVQQMRGAIAPGHKWDIMVIALKIFTLIALPFIYVVLCIIQYSIHPFCQYAKCRLIKLLLTLLDGLHHFTFSFGIVIRQVDLFFYREPEEAKDPQEEEVAAIQDYPDYGATAIGGGEWSSSQIPDVQWTADPVAAAPVAGGWAGEEGKFSHFFCNPVFMC